LQFSFLEAVPESMTGGRRDGDDAFRTITARRPVAEAAIARVAAATPGVEIRRGTAVAGLVTGPSARDGVPNVVGVRTEAGDELRADVVVDATGRRSPLPAWLAAIGARAPHEELDDAGFVYYGRHFRSHDGSVPPLMGPPLYYAESIAILVLPADNGTWGIGLVTVSGDTAARSLRDRQRWTSAVKSFALHAHWLDGEPLDDQVITMAKLEDRRRRFVLDGVPVATGVLPLADAWACTNPSVGRGISIGMIHAVALRDQLRSEVDDPYELALAWHDTTSATVEPYYESTLFHDRHRLAELSAGAESRAYDGGDAWELWHRFTHGSNADPDLFRAYLSVAGVLEVADDVLARPEIVERCHAVGADWRDAPVFGPSREEIVAIANS
jgi:flavin-dependent dehydrogenase